ncbi:hypothetical protein Q5M49_05635 [Acinetobacter nosocomialis]|uniref:HNH endonuclease n=1 Tax=Acinetobacter nosocomialis TaxID=106654 RepID=UPI0026FEB298|nr:hypothetical protein [Acinetobacter nosocomialis]MDO7193167.1 hypothetical protein [Acinetobacter nosocomialis]
MNKVIFSEICQNYISSYDGLSYQIWNTTQGVMIKIRKEIRDHYKVEQNYKCCYCRQQNLQDHGGVWDCEHILPKAIYPKFLFEPLNLVLSCKECNIAKEKYKNDLIKIVIDDYSTNSTDYRIIHPHFDIYEDHIEVLVLEGLNLFKIKENSEKGKFTYICCNLARFDKKIVGYDEIGDHVSLTINTYLEQGLTSEEILKGLCEQSLSIFKRTDF